MRKDGEHADVEIKQMRHLRKEKNMIFRSMLIVMQPWMINLQKII